MIDAVAPGRRFDRTVPQRVGALHSGRFVAGGDAARGEPYAHHWFEKEI
ncbi:hypothetical protein ACQEVB_03370 [Pseudonocardia sp. CA-107938]